MVVGQRRSDVRFRGSSQIANSVSYQCFPDKALIKLISKMILTNLLPIIMQNNQLIWMILWFFESDFRMGGRLNQSLSKIWWIAPKHLTSFMDVPFIKKSEKKLCLLSLKYVRQCSLHKIDWSSWFSQHPGMKSNWLSLGYFEKYSTFSGYLLTNHIFTIFFSFKSAYVLLMFGRILELRLFFNLCPNLILSSLILEKGKTLF